MNWLFKYGYAITWHGRLAWRIITVLDVIVMFALLPVSVLLYGVTGSGQELPRHLKAAWKSLKSGQAGPWKGCVW